MERVCVCHCVCDVTTLQELANFIKLVAKLGRWYSLHVFSMLKTVSNPDCRLLRILAWLRIHMTCQCHPIPLFRFRGHLCSRSTLHE